jgi:hypothetical protein
VKEEEANIEKEQEKKGNDTDPNKRKMCLQYDQLVILH